MNFIENQWKLTKFIEIYEFHWKSMKINEIHWKLQISLKINENSLNSSKLMNFIQNQWKWMKFNKKYEFHQKSIEINEKYKNNQISLKIIQHVWIHVHVWFSIQIDGNRWNHNTSVSFLSSYDNQWYAWKTMPFLNQPWKSLAYIRTHDSLRRHSLIRDTYWCCFTLMRIVETM